MHASMAPPPPAGPPAAPPPAPSPEGRPMHASMARRRRGVLVAGLALTAVAGGTPALAAGPQPFLAGLTSQQQPVLVRLSADGRTVARALTTLHLHCTSGATFYQPDGFANTHVSTLRRFRITYA